MQFFAPLLALVAVATAIPTGTSPSGGAQCCQNVENSSSASSATKTLVKTALGIDISDLNVPIGTGCTPLAVGGGVSCNMNTVNCGTVYQSALIGINCVPIIVNL